MCIQGVNWQCLMHALGLLLQHHAIILEPLCVHESAVAWWRSIAAQNLCLPFVCSFNIASDIHSHIG